jgi:hypothetical protein
MQSTGVGLPAKLSASLDLDHHDEADAKRANSLAPAKTSMVDGWYVQRPNVKDVAPPPVDA